MLEAERLSIAFGGLRAVQDASLTVPEGRIVALIGPNGAGKTTMFAMISGFLRPNAGRVRFLGQDITGLAPHRISLLGLVCLAPVVAQRAIVSPLSLPRSPHGIASPPLLLPTWECVGLLRVIASSVEHIAASASRVLRVGSS